MYTDLRAFGDEVAEGGGGPLNSTEILIPQGLVCSVYLIRPVSGPC